MTRNTYRYNVKMMLRSVTGMMVLLCLCRTRTFQSIRAGQFAGGDSIINGLAGLESLWIFNTKSFLDFSRFSCFSIIFSITMICYLSFFCLVIFLFNSVDYLLASFCFLIFIPIVQMAGFAIILITTFSTRTFVKIRQWFCLLADSAGFCYGDFNHLLLLVRSKCSGPVAGTYQRSARFIISAKGVSVNS